VSLFIFYLQDDLQELQMIRQAIESDKRFDEVKAIYLQVNEPETNAGNLMRQTNAQPGFFTETKKLLNFIDNYLNFY
jgi:hypothetical protein